MAAFYSILVFIALAPLGFGMETLTKPLICPNYTFNADLTDPVVKTREIRRLVNITTDAKLYRSKLSSNAKKLENFIIEMANSEEKILQELAYLIRLKYSLFLPQDNIILCGVAKGINASLKFYQTNDFANKERALQTFSSTFKGCREVCTRAILLAAGCKNIDPPKCPVPSCPDNGYNIPLKDFWNAYGRFLPCFLKEIIEKLYKSKQLQDKAFAIVAIAAIDECIVDIFKPISELPNFTTLNMLSIKIPQQCCNQRKKILEDIVDERSAIIKDSIEKIIEENEFPCDTDVSCPSD